MEMTVADHAPLAEGLHHADQRQKNPHRAEDQADLNSILPEAEALSHCLLSCFDGEFEIPNPKHQIPNNIQNSNLQIRNPALCYGLFAKLEFIWDLGFGAWNFMGSGLLDGQPFPQESGGPEDQNEHQAG